MMMMVAIQKSLQLLITILLSLLVIMANSSAMMTSSNSSSLGNNNLNDDAEKNKQQQQQQQQTQHVLVDRWSTNALRIRIYPARPAVPPDTETALGYLLPPLHVPSSKNQEEAATTNNLEATVAADTGFITIKRVSDGTVLLAQTTPLQLSHNVVRSDGSRAMNVTFTIDPRVDRVFGGGCKCGGGYRPQDSEQYGAGAMINTGDPNHGTGDLHWGIPIGLAKMGPTPGGLGSQCGFMNGMPFHVAAITGEGLSFGLFDNTMGWTFGTSSPKRHSVMMHTNRATHLNFLLITYAAETSSKGADRANSIIAAYADALGHVPVMPKQVTGYWHSKCSIASQQEALSTVHGFHSRGLHVDVLVLDYQYKSCDGCTSFDTTTFPNPAQMVTELKSKYGTHVMAHVNIEQNFSSILNGATFLHNHWYLQQQFNSTAAKTPLCRSTNSDGEPAWDNTTCRYDPTIPEARELLWKSVNATLVKAGIYMFWLDGNEIIGEDPWETPSAPLMDSPMDFSSLSLLSSPPQSHPGRGQTMFSTGPNDVVGTFFPYLHQQTFAEGIARENLPPPAMILSRATTPGSWRLGGASWDGDHYCEYSDYLNHLYGSLDAQLSGQLWWSVDVGGFFCQMNEETMSRDFLLSVTAPIMRQHGDRDTRIWGPTWTPMMTAAATAAIKLRESLRDYIHGQLAIAAATGVPLQRYLWHDFPTDADVWDIQSQFMFGSDFMVAPVVVEKARGRTVYFPIGYDWVQHHHQHDIANMTTTERRYTGGTSATVLVALDELAMFKKVPTLDVVKGPTTTTASTAAKVPMHNAASIGITLTLNVAALDDVNVKIASFFLTATVLLLVLIAVQKRNRTTTRAAWYI